MRRPKPKHVTETHIGPLGRLFGMKVVKRGDTFVVIRLPIWARGVSCTIGPRVGG